MKALLFAESMRFFGRPRVMRQKQVQTSLSYLVLCYQANTHNEVIFIVFGRKLGNKTRKPMTDNKVFNYC